MHLIMAIDLAVALLIIDPSRFTGLTSYRTVSLRKVGGARVGGPGDPVCERVWS